MVMLKRSFTIGQQIVERARTGLRGYGEFVLAPADCQYILDHCDFTQPVKNPGDQQTNRKLKKARVAAYVTSMTDRGVIDTGDTLKFDTNGNLFDGRHRMTAAIEAGVSLLTLVAFGRSTEAFAVTDSATGARKKAELFEMAGIQRGPLLNGVTSILMNWRDDHFIQKGHAHTGEVLLNFYLDTIDDDLMQECAALCDRAYRRGKTPLVYLCALLYTLRTKGDEAWALEFMRCIIEADWEGKNAALGVFFKYYAVASANPAISLRAPYKMALLIHTWNKFHARRKGKTEELTAVAYDVKPDLTVERVK